MVGTILVAGVKSVVLSGRKKELAAQDFGQRESFVWMWVRRNFANTYRYRGRFDYVFDLVKWFRRDWWII